MNLNWSNRVIKYVLFIFNLLFVISGIILIAVGVSVKEYYSDYDIFLNNSYFSLPNLLIAIGSLIFFISFFGCCGAIRESWFMIFLFSILLSIIFIMEFSAGIAGYVLRDNTASYLTDSLKDSMAKYKFNQNATSHDGPTVMWDAIQRNFKCCGASSPTDWKQKTTTTGVTLKASVTAALKLVGGPGESSSSDSSSSGVSSTTPTTLPTVTSTSSTTVSTNTPTSTNATALTSGAVPTTTSATTVTTSPAPDEFPLPFSCCRSRPGTGGEVYCIYNNETTAKFYREGCVEGFGDYLKEHAVTIGGVGIAIALIQLFGVIFACHLTKQLKHGFYST